MKRFDIVGALSKLKQEIPADVTLVAVSKTKPVSDIKIAYNAGHRDFGENKVQEMVDKQQQLPGDIRWHFIGHLQRNKVKYLIDFVYLIHSVDSIKLIKEIDKRSGNAEKKTRILFQISIADEETKFGFDFGELLNAHEDGLISKFENIAVCGVMGMATNTEDNDKIAGEFRMLKQYFKTLKDRYYKDHDEFRVLSMGMTSDYGIALEEGSNMLRMGSRIFGYRS